MPREHSGSYLSTRLPREQRGPLCWLHCGCQRPQPMRIHRSAWMRMLPLLRHYACLGCGRRTLRPRLGWRPRGDAIYLPAPPLRECGSRMMKMLGMLPPTSTHRR